MGRGEEGDWGGVGWKPQAAAARGGCRGWGAGTPRLLSHRRAVSSVLTLKAIQSEVCILVSSDVTANH